VCYYGYVGREYKVIAHQHQNQSPENPEDSLHFQMLRALWIGVVVICTGEMKKGGECFE
jgi:hypothetical protein